MPNTAVVEPQPGDEITSAWGISVAEGMNGIQAGTANVTLTAANNGSTPITFPRPYASPPIVVVAYSGTNLLFIAAVHSVTTTGCVLVMSTKTAANTTDTRAVNWLAMGVPA